MLYYFSHQLKIDIVTHQQPQLAIFGSKIVECFNTGTVIVKQKDISVRQRKVDKDMQLKDKLP